MREDQQMTEVKLRTQLLRRSGTSGVEWADMAKGRPMTTNSMARLLSRLLRVRWDVALGVGRGVALELRDAHDRLEPRERARLGELVKRSGGRPQHLSRGERLEVVRLAVKAAGLLA
jgi:hypothetical protein